MDKVAKRTYSGSINKNGYPRIKVNYKWKMCNNNESESGMEQVKLVPSESSALNKAVSQPINKGGVINEGKCRKFETMARINTERRSHRISTKISGFLKIGDTIYDSEPDIRKCSDEEIYRIRVRVSSIYFKIYVHSKYNLTSFYCSQTILFSNKRKVH